MEIPSCYNKFNPVLGYMPIMYTPEMSRNLQYRYGTMMTKDKFMSMVFEKQPIPLRKNCYQQDMVEDLSRFADNWHRLTNRDVTVKILRYIKMKGRFGATYHEICKNVLHKPVGHDRDTFLMLAARFIENFHPETGKLGDTCYHRLTKTSFFCLNQFGDQILKYADVNEPIADLEQRFSEVMHLVKKRHMPFIEAAMRLMMESGKCITADDVKYWISQIDMFMKQPKFAHFKSRLYNYKKFLKSNARY